MTRTLVAGVVAIGWGLWGCGGDGGDCPTGGRGALELTIRGLPEGADAAVRLSGPSGEPRTATASTTFPDVEAGLWVASSPIIAAPGGLVRRAFALTEAREVCVRDSSAALAVDYEQVASSGKLWAGAQNSSGPLLAWSAESLGTSGTAAPTAVIVSRPEIPTGRGIAFDAQGRLWAADANGSLKRFAAKDLGTGATVEPEVVLTSPDFGGGIPGPTHLAFDPAGNLWVSVAAADRILRFAPEQLDAGGEQAAAVALTTASDGPGALAFDAEGNLWASIAGRLHKYAAARLATAPTSSDLALRAIDINTTSTSLGTPSGLAFDGAGNLWVSYFLPSVIAKLTPAELVGTAQKDVRPPVQLELSVSALLDGLVLDEDGGLWTPLSNGKLGRLAPGQLSASGSVTPEVQLTATELGAAHGLASYPAPANTPLFHRLP